MRAARRAARSARRLRPAVAAVILAAWNVNSLNVRLPRLARLAGRRSAPTSSACRKRSSRTRSFRCSTTRRRRLCRALRRTEDVQRRGDPRPRRPRGRRRRDRHRRLRRRAEARDRRDGRRHPRRRRLRAERPGGRLGQVPSTSSRGTRRSPRCCARSSRAIRRSRSLGDFNVAPEDRDVHDPALWAGQVLCSEPERAAFARVLAVGLVDSFRLFDQPDEDVLVVGLPAARVSRRTTGCASTTSCCPPPLAARCTASRIDRNARKGEKPSDHAPVLVGTARLTHCDSRCSPALREGATRVPPIAPAARCPAPARAARLRALWSSRRRSSCSCSCR